MDFSILRRLEALVAMVVAAALGSAATVVVVKPPAAEVERCAACMAELAELRREIEQAVERPGGLATLKEATDTGIRSRPVGIEELRR